MNSSSYMRPERVVVVGAGMVGLSTAWFLQEAGVEVTVLDRDDVAAGSSWGNAGWLTPSIAVPLPEPSVLKYGFKAVLSPSSPVYVPPTANPRLLRFLAQFGRNCTHPRWQRAMAALIPLNNGSLDAFAELEQGGVTARTKPAEPFTAAFRTVADSKALLEEFEHIKASGQDVAFDIVDGDAARADEPALSGGIAAAIRIRNQRFIDPAAYVESVAASVRARGGRILAGQEVDDVVSQVRVPCDITAPGPGEFALLLEVKNDEGDVIGESLYTHLVIDPNATSSD